MHLLKFLEIHMKQTSKHSEEGNHRWCICSFLWFESKIFQISSSLGLFHPNYFPMFESFVSFDRLISGLWLLFLIWNHGGWLLLQHCQIIEQSQNPVKHHALGWCQYLYGKNILRNFILFKLYSQSLSTPTIGIKPVHGFYSIWILYSGRLPSKWFPRKIIQASVPMVPF